MTQDKNNKGALDKARSAPPKNRNLPSAFRKGQIPVYFQQIEPGQSGAIPNASLVYGIGAAILFGVALFFTLSGSVGTGLLIFIPSVCLFGYAVHFMRYSS